MFPNLLLTDKTFYATSTARIQNRRVFQWFLTNESAFGGTSAAGSSSIPNPFWPKSPTPALAGINNYMQEISMAQAAGYDGFALDEWAPGGGALGANDKANVAAIFEAARQMGTGFKLYFVFNDVIGDTASAANYLYLLETYHDHPNYYNRSHTAAVVSGYAPDYVQPTGIESVQWWSDQVFQPLAKLQTPITAFFAPMFVGGLVLPGGCGGQVASWANDGDSLWGLGSYQIQAAPLGNGFSCLDKMAASAHAARVSAVSTYSWHYWVEAFNALPGWCKSSCSGGGYYEHGGGMGLALAWASIINTELPDWVIQLTDNDIQESASDTADFAAYRQSPGNGIYAYTPLGWYTPQLGMAALARYYQQWYRSGVQPTITGNAIFYDYVPLLLSYTVPTTNLFRASIGNGLGGSGNILTVSSVQQGYVVPGETVTFNNGATAQITGQLSGTTNGAGTYTVSNSLYVATVIQALQQSMSTAYYATQPTAELQGQSANSVYVTVAALRANTEFSATGGGSAYSQATVDGVSSSLPVTLSAGLHQIVISDYKLGAQSFALSVNGSVTTQATGPAIVNSAPIYNWHDVSGFAM